MQGHPPTSSERSHASSTEILLVGIVALAMAMGIGRFAFTPLLPLMIRDGNIDILAGAEWAMGNYLGYLAGALTASRFARTPARGLLAGLTGVALSTLLTGSVSANWPAAAGTLLRAAAGVFSAWTLVCASVWCLNELARRGDTVLSGWMYTGVGSGITAAGILAWLGGAQPASWLWMELGVVTCLGTAFAFRAIRRPALDTAFIPDTTEPHKPPKPHKPASAIELSTKLAIGPLIVCYGVFGYGYIVLGTFLPAMAREQVADPIVFGLTWPLFGLAAALSVAAATRWLAHWPRARIWALAQTAMAIGTALPLFTQSLWSLAIAAILVGGTFVVATMAGLQLARQLEPANPTPLLARMTVAFALGQIAGPALIRWIGTDPIAGKDSFFWANALATALLIISASWIWLHTAGSAHRSISDAHENH